jgi:hypothetical protein
LLRSVLVEWRDAASSASLWAAARASSRSLVATAAAESPEAEAMGDVGAPAQPIGRGAAGAARERRQGERSRPGGKEKGRGTRRAPGKAEAGEGMRD